MHVNAEPVIASVPRNIDWDPIITDYALEGTHLTY